jgi:hypothetical protein
MEEAISPNLNWRLLGPGSAGCYLELGGQDVELRTSYLGDALRGLMRAALDLKVGSSSALAYFLGEPAGYRMVFSGGEQGEVYMQVVYFSDLQSEGREWMDGKVLWAGLISIEGFIAAVRRMGGEVVVEYGEEGYLKIWGMPFPGDMLRLLEG